MKVYGHGKVSRNVTISHCYGQQLNDANGEAEFVDFCFDVYGTYTAERATRFARRAFADRSIVINKVEHETHFYAMDLPTFVELAERTNNNG